MVKPCGKEQCCRRGRRVRARASGGRHDACTGLAETAAKERDRTMKLLVYTGPRGPVPENRMEFVSKIRQALSMRDCAIAPEDAHAAWSAYSASAGWPWVRVPEDTYEVLSRIRPHLRPEPAASR
uniref:Uncharacterized protein n=2 Tax=Cereibacter TaxID=1653176 RepID=A4WZA4_CERS5